MSNASPSGGLGESFFTIGVADADYKKKLMEAEDQAAKFSKNTGKHLENVELSAHKAHRGFHALTLASGALTGETKNLGEGLMRAGNFLERAAISFGAEGPMFIGIMGLGVAI